MGSPAARLAKATRISIPNQAALDYALSQVPPERREAGLDLIRPYLKFVPLQDRVKKTEEVVADSSGN